jgi:hypothetical protein
VEAADDKDLSELLNEAHFSYKLIVRSASAAYDPRTVIEVGGRSPLAGRRYEGGAA